MTEPTPGLLLVAPDEEPETEPQEEPQEQVVPQGTLEENADQEWPFRPRPLWLRDLIVDHSYQRPVEEKFVAAAVDDYEEALVGVIDVSERGGGAWAILDGQQRYEMSRRIGKTTMICAVYTGLTIEDEAARFYRSNKDRKAMRGFYGFNARMVAGDLEARAIAQAVEGVGFKLGPLGDNDTVIGAMRAIERAWELDSEHRDECLTPALVSLRAYKGRSKSLDATAIMGLAHFWRAFPDEAVEIAHLDAVLEDVKSPANLIGLGRERSLESKWRVPQGIALTLVDRYNARVKAASGVARNVADFPGRLDPEAVR